jgi:hypothetical protein
MISAPLPCVASVALLLNQAVNIPWPSLAVGESYNSQQAQQ